MTSEATPHNRQATRQRLGAVIAAVAAIVFVIWFAFIRGDDESGSNGPVPEAVSVTDLQGLPSQVGHAVYWIGARPGTTYEQTRNARGDVFIRYLPEGVAVGDQRPNYITVGTYPFTGAYAALRKLARRKGTSSGSLPGNGIYVIGKERPNSVYLAYRGQDLQIEVFAPAASRARQLVTSGRVQPVG